MKERIFRMEKTGEVQVQEKDSVQEREGLVDETRCWEDQEAMGRGDFEIGDCLHPGNWL